MQGPKRTASTLAPASSVRFSTAFCSNPGRCSHSARLSCLLPPPTPPTPAPGYAAGFAITATVITCITSCVAYKLKRMDEEHGMLA